MATEEQKKGTMTLAQASNTMLQTVLNEISEKAKNGLVFPDGYLAENAVMSAMLIIQKTVDKNGVPALQCCKPLSIKQAVWEMLDRGLDPGRTHCYFIVYGDQLTMMESYFGTVYRAMTADSNIASINAKVVYEKDIIKPTMTDGVYTKFEHTPDLDNMDFAKARGAYAVIKYKDGTCIGDYQTMAQIKMSWSKSKSGGGVAREFPDSLARRTVLKKLAKFTLSTVTNKPLINETYADDFDQEADMNEATEPLDITPQEEKVISQVTVNGVDQNGNPVRERYQTLEPVPPVESNQGTVSQVTTQELQQESFDNESLDDLPPMFQ
jgi:recombination protein RecT